MGGLNITANLCAIFLFIFMFVGEELGSMGMFLIHITGVVGLEDLNSTLMIYVVQPFIVYVKT